MAKLATQQRLNHLAVGVIGLCETLETFFSVSGVLLPEIKKRLDTIQELAYQVCPEAHKRDFALAYAAVQGQTVELNGETQDETIPI